MEEVGLHPMEKDQSMAQGNAWNKMKILFATEAITKDGCFGAIQTPGQLQDDHLRSIRSRALKKRATHELLNRSV
jgi:hypothetical protein